MNQPVPEAYLEARLEVPTQLVDSVCDFIIENIASGIVLEEEEGASQTNIIFYVPEGDTRYRDKLAEFLTRQVPGVIAEVPEIRQRQVTNDGWLDKYHESVSLLRIADDLIVRPTWIAPTEDRYQLVLEPKMAFGTGTHATTRSSLGIIRRNFKSGMRFLDMGCGSGILSILADQMGASYIKAIDYDLAAIANCRENFEINQVSTAHDVVAGSIEKCEQDKPYQFVCANIIRSTILTMLGSLLRLTVDGGWLVLSGLLDKDEDAVAGALREHGQDDFSITRDENWLTYSVRKR